MKAAVQKAVLICIPIHLFQKMRIIYILGETTGEVRESLTGSDVSVGWNTRQINKIWLQKSVYLLKWHHSLFQHDASSGNTQLHILNCWPTEEDYSMSINMDSFDFIFYWTIHLSLVLVVWAHLSMVKHSITQPNENNQQQKVLMRWEEKKNTIKNALFIV